MLGLLRTTRKLFGSPLAGILLVGVTAASAADRPPNIIFILTDDK